MRSQTSRGRTLSSQLQSNPLQPLASRVASVFRRPSLSHAITHHHTPSQATAPHRSKSADILIFPALSVRSPPPLDARAPGFVGCAAPRRAWHQPAPPPAAL
uniref:Uncharacterized protein n=1 Tax=Macaca nemestrina TaxID=9545 RepID=A0A2K6D1E8_MACNE